MESASVAHWGLTVPLCAMAPRALPTAPRKAKLTFPPSSPSLPLLFPSSLTLSLSGKMLGRGWDWARHEGSQTKPGNCRSQWQHCVRSDLQLST